MLLQPLHPASPASSQMSTRPVATQLVPSTTPSYAISLRAQDFGKEFAEHQGIAYALCCGFYFADPYSAWQRGSNENANGLACQCLSRKMDFSKIT